MPQNNNINNFSVSSLRHFQVFLQKIGLSVNLFVKNELFNHAGAAAFFFIVSIPPVFLLLIIAFDRFLVSYSEASEILFAFMKNINENLDKDLLVKIGLLNVNPTAIGIFGLLNLLWAGRAILTAIQRGLGVIFPAEKIRPPVVTNVMSFIILSILLAVSVLLTFVSIGFKFLQQLLRADPVVQSFFQSLLPYFRQFVPFFVVVLLIFLAYRFVPPNRPKTASSFVSAVGCSLAIYFIHILFLKFFTVTQYNVIYGVLGSLILMVLWVYFSFLLFFFFAEFTFVSDNIDVLVLDKMLLLRINQDIRVKKIEKFLYNHPKWIFEKYASRFHAGDIVFREGDSSTDIYFVEQGNIHLVQEIEGDDKKIASVGNNEIFGATAFLLDECRKTTAVAETESVLLVMKPYILEELLQVNPSFSRDIIQLLCDRLRTIAPKAAI
jgi:membrane protein